MRSCKYLHINTPELALKYSTLLKSKPGVPTAVDTEFDDNGDGNIEPVLMSYASEGDTQAYVVDAIFVGQYYADYFSDPQNKCVYQNFKADFGTLEALGVNSHPSFHADTMILSWNVDENQLQHGLKAQSATFLKWPRAGYKQIFSYIPVGKKQAIMLKPTEVMNRLPLECLEATAQLLSVTQLRPVASITKAEIRKWWRATMLQYSADDAWSTIALYGKHKAHLKEIGYWGSYIRHDRRYTETLIAIEKRGVQIDLERMHEILREVDITVMRAEHAFRAVAGNPTLKLSSNPQLQDLFFRQWRWRTEQHHVTPSGSPSLDRAAMEKYAERYPIANVKLDYTSACTLRNTFLRGIIDGLSDDGRLRSDFSQIGANTGRISSRKRIILQGREVLFKNGRLKTYITKQKVGANLQNIPSRKEKDPYGIRGAFRAPRLGEVNAFGEITTEPMSLIVCDYSGFELVMVLHWVSKFRKTSPMLDAMLKYGSPSAIHAYSAIKLYGDAKALDGTRLGDISMDNWTQVKKLFPDKYSIAKNNNFNLLYGGSASMMCRLRGMDPHNERHLDLCGQEIASWTGIFYEIPEYQASMIEHGSKHGWVPTIGGRRATVYNLLRGRTSDGRYEPDENKQRMLKAFGQRKCMNTPAQGSAADIVKVAMNLVERDQELKTYRCASLFPVHDELVLEVPTRFAPQALARTMVLMKQPYRDQMKFELSVDGKYAENWLDAK
jgi:DNA polymerase-1